MQMRALCVLLIAVMLPAASPWKEVGPRSDDRERVQTGYQAETCSVWVRKDGGLKLEAQDVKSMENGKFRVSQMVLIDPGSPDLRERLVVEQLVWGQWQP